MEGNKLMLGPGKTAPCLIKDLGEYDVRHPPRSGRNLLADPAPQYKNSPNVRRGPLDCVHQLMRNDSHTYAPASRDYTFDGTERFTVATYCTKCRYHFTIIADYRNGQRICRLTDESSLLHHFIHIKTENGEQHAVRCVHENIVDDSSPLAECQRFICSSPSCALRVEIKISPPRLPQNLLNLILDTPKVIARGQKEVSNQPDRYTGLQPVRPFQALSYLRAYVRDAKSGSEATPVNLRRIAKRNKKYMLAFGEDCDSLFEHLGFTSTLEDSNEANPEMFWQPPFVDDHKKKFYDDVLIEIELLMLSRPPTEHQSAQPTVISLRPFPAMQDIERTLGYFEFPTRSRVVDLSQDEHPYYASLGALSTFTDTYLEWAYDRQVECDPLNKPYYLDCLDDLANGRKSGDLQTRVIMCISRGELGLKAIEGAYNFFGLDSNTKEADDHIMGLYRSRIESAPRQKEEAKQNLLILAKSRNSAKIEALANDRTMTMNEALEFLNVTSDTASDSIEAAAVAMSSDTSPAEIARALRVIANERDDFSLRNSAATLESNTNDLALDINEAYNRLQVGSHNASDDSVFNYYTSLSANAAAGSKESFAQALRTIAQNRQSHFLLRKLEDPDADIQADPSTADQPVGLDNIGNTCYLNSLLQYFYTIRAVREVAMNIDKHRMELSEGAIKNRKVGGRAVTRPEVIKGQKLVEQLHDLFEELKMASTRSVKPTKELAELSFFSDLMEENLRRASITSPITRNVVFGPEGPPPPMPTRPSPATIDEDVEMIDDPSDQKPHNGSEASEATLVDLELPPYEEINGKEAVSNANSAEQKTDTTMIDGDGAATLPLSPPTTPPPIPPRNKSGLAIQTYEIPDDDTRWKFGTQQDVDEVIRNTTFRMMCAIKPTSTDPGTGDQIDQIRATFYGDNAVYTSKTSKLERKVEVWSSLLVYAVRNKTIDIYEALDTIFDAQQVAIDSSFVPQHTSINTLPPVLQIQINRANFDVKTGSAYKIKNEVKFPETIYLDRYMDAQEPNSVLMSRREQSWAWKAELRILEARVLALHNIASDSELEVKFPILSNGDITTSTNIDVIEALLATKDFVASLQEEEIEGMDIDPTLFGILDERVSEVGAELNRLNRKIAILKQSLAEQFTDMRQFEYKLQAVFIHRGEAGGGHYWIYIYDFKNDIWREYNDEYVTLVKDRKKIFEHPNGHSGTPYYLVYVRSADRDELVDPVYREVRVEEPQVMAWDHDEGIDLEDVEDVRHIEHVKPRRIRPRPCDDGSGYNEWQDAVNRAAHSQSLDPHGRPW